MGKSYVENSLKRFLKRKVKITLGFVVAFMITGAVAFAEGTAEEGSTQWHKECAEKYLAGIKDGTSITLDEITAGDVKISSDNAGGIKITSSNKEVTVSKNDLSSLTGSVIQNSLDLISGKNISGITDVDGYNEGLSLENNEEITINKSINNVGQKITKGKAYNYGLIVANNINGQETISNEAELYNYGIITGSGNIAGQKLGTSNSKAYNYGLISLIQFGQHTLGKTSSELYNYGIIKSSGAGQYLQGANIGYNYGIIENEKQSAQIISNAKAVGYNYGIIRNKSNGGQHIEKGGTGYNYGVIENQGDNGQNINASENGTAYNYGIIKNSGKNAINAGNNGQAYNYGVVDFRNNTTTNIFNGNVENKGIIISNASDLGKLTLGKGKNSGVILDSNLGFNAQYNSKVTELTNSVTIDGSENKTYYVKDRNIEFKNNLTGNVLTAVITSENKNPVFKYTGDDKLVLKDSSVMGYFLASGTLLELGKDKELVLANSKINTVVGVGSDAAKVTAVKLDGGTLTQVGESEIAGKVVGKGATGYISVHNDNQNVTLESGNINLTNDDGTYGLSKTNTEVTFNTIKADNLNLDFTVNTNKNVNKVTLNNAELKSIDGSSSTEKIELTLDSTEKVGNITLGQNDDKFTVTNSSHNGIIDMGAGDNDEFNLSMGAVDTTNHHKEAGNTFDYKVNGAEKIVLNGDGWHIGENAELNAGTTTKAGEKTELHIADKGSLHVDMNNNYGAGNVTTSLDKMAGGADLSLSTGTDAEVKFVVGDKFDVSQKQFDVAHSYSVAGANLGTAVIFKGTGTNGAVEEKDGKISLTVKEASEVGLSGYEGIYNAVLKGLSKDDDLRNAVNYQDESNLVSMIKTAGETAEAFYTTGYAVTKDVTDTYMSVVEDFGRKAGKGEWIAYGKYVNSDTEFDGGKASKGYDGDITGTVGMLEYGVDETTSYGVVYGQGDTKVDIQGGGKLDGDNTYFGGYVKHRTQNGIDLTGNIGITKSELDLSLATNTKTQGGVNHHIITDGNSDADALTFSIKGTKDYKVTDTIRLQPVVSGRYSFISQDEVTSSDANFKMDEQDITIFEGAFGGNIIKDFDIYNGRLSLSAGAEYVLTDVNKDDNARYHLYNEDLHFTGEEDIADNRIEGHIGIDYEHESGVGVDAKYEMIWTDKGDNSRVTAGISYRF